MDLVKFWGFESGSYLIDVTYVLRRFPNMLLAQEILFFVACFSLLVWEFWVRKGQTSMLFWSFPCSFLAEKYRRKGRQGFELGRRPLIEQLQKGGYHDVSALPDKQPDCHANSTSQGITKLLCVTVA